MNCQYLQQGQHHYLVDTDVLADFDPQLFDPQFLAQVQGLNRLGRGAAVMFEHRGLNLVLKHYQRGGAVARLNRDHYLYGGLAMTRMWREFRLLQQLHQQGLPVPLPLAAHCQRSSLWTYRGDLITCTIQRSQTLAQYLQQQALPAGLWQALGRTLALFHRRGVYHADLNANNILLDAEGRFYLIDFDKGRQKSADWVAWRNRNLQRLLHSLRKQQRLHPGFHFDESNWQWMLDAYRAQ